MKKVLNVLAVLLGVLSSNSYGQGSVEIVSPTDGLEVNNTTVPINIQVRNPDTINTHTLWLEFSIKNIVTGLEVYGNGDKLKDMLPGEVRTIRFPGYIMSVNKLNQIGSFSVCASVVKFDSSNHQVAWEFADTVCGRLFGIRTTALPFQETSDNYSKAGDIELPDQMHWVSFGARVLDGIDNTWDPPPPTSIEEGGLIGPDSLHAPVICMNRFVDNKKSYIGEGVGDTLTSFPYNLTGQTKIILSFDFMRSGRNTYSDMWDSVKMIGAEHTVLDKNGNVLRAGDSLIIEFKDPSEPVCNPVKWNQIVAIDGGIDHEFKSVSLKFNVGSAEFRMTGMEPRIIPISKEYFDTTFRFRLRLKANNSADMVVKPKDDEDSWFIDNISLGVPRLPEVEVMWVRIVTPYSKIPFSAATAMPVYFSVRNLYTDIAIAFPMKVWITDNLGKTVYSENINVNSLRGGSDSVIRMPDWNAQPWITTAWDQSFRVHAALASSSYDSYTQNNETFSYFYPNWDINSGMIQEFGYDDGRNDLPSIKHIIGTGAGFSNITGSYAMKFTLPHSDTIYGGRIFFSAASSSPDKIRILLYKDDSSHCVPGETFKREDGTEVLLEDGRMGGLFNQYWSYYFSNPVVVPAGNYWLSISQLGLNNMMIGGNISRGSGIIKIADTLSPQIIPLHSDPYGTQVAPGVNTGNISCSYALETPAGSGNWQKWIPESGYWPTNTSGSGKQSTSWDPNLSFPYNRGGSFLPMIRVMVGGTTKYLDVKKELSNNFAFEESYPNPFTPGVNSTELNFTLDQSGNVSFIIYDAIGREIYSLFQGKLSSGKHSFHWDGRDAKGAFVSEGAYLCRLCEGDRTASVKILVIR